MRKSKSKSKSKRKYRAKFSPGNEPETNKANILREMAILRSKEKLFFSFLNWLENEGPIDIEMLTKCKNLRKVLMLEEL